MKIISNKNKLIKFIYREKNLGFVPTMGGIHLGHISLIKRSINILEKNEDKDFIWRKYVNEKLKKEYKKLFAMIDHFIFMKIPNFNMVFKWRLLQENKLRKVLRYKKKIMSYNEIKRFIMFYQRITLQMVRDLSKSASIVMLLNKNHEIKKLLFKS